MSDFEDNSLEQALNNAQEAVEVIDNVEAEAVETVEAEVVEEAKDYVRAEAGYEQAAQNMADFAHESINDNAQGTYTTGDSFTHYSSGNGGAQASTETPEGGKASGFAIASLCCGIVSILCCCANCVIYPLAIAAIVFGCISIYRQERLKGMAIAGIACGGVGIILNIVFNVIAQTGAQKIYDLNDYDMLREYLEEYL